MAGADPRVRLFGLDALTGEVAKATHCS